MASSTLGSVLYRSISKRFSTLFLTAVIGAFAVETIIVKGNDYYWEKHNKGKLWKDVQQSLQK